MSDILVDLYDSYKTSLATNMVSGQTLDFLRYAAPPGDVDLTALWGLLPCLLYFWQDTPMEADSMEGTCRSDKKFYNFEMNCIFEMQDISYGTASPSVPAVRDHIEDAAAIETLYNRNTLDVSSACWMTRMWSGAPTFPGYSVDGVGWIYAVNFSFVHLWQDRRYT